MALVLLANSAYADPWEDFYNKYAGKYFVISWREISIFKNNSANPILEVEYAYTTTSPTTIYYTTRRNYPNAANKEKYAEEFDNTASKGQPVYSGSNWQELLDIDDNKIFHEINYRSDNGPYKKLSQFTISIKNNKCSAIIKTEAERAPKSYSGISVVKIERSPIICKIIDNPAN